MSFTIFGKAHEELEDEQNTGITKRPKRVEEEIVTDEKGRRRFHGAFTGGFSAGYFNTVGSKLGWEPQTFKSTRDDRAEKVQYSATDFMDEEDRGQYGFAAEKIRLRDDFLDNVTSKGSSQLAWERAGPSTSKAPVGVPEWASQIEQSIQPVNNSIGVRILKQMGWRPGKGIGPKLARRALEKQKMIDARSRGEKVYFDERRVRDIEEFAPDIEFSPDDIPKLFFESNDKQHGMGYEPLKNSNVLDESFALKVDSLKTKANSKGIKGQAFGVGVYDSDDEEVYTSEDLSKYDYAIGKGAQNLREVERYDSNFVLSNENERLVSYNAPQPTKHFNPRHRAEPITLKNLPSSMVDAMDHLTPLQKAVFLGDRSGSVMELLSNADREKLELLTRKTEKEFQVKDEKKNEERQRHAPEPFEEEPLKAHRFKKYVHYLKSGYDMPPPETMTRLEWERELVEFETHLTPELRAMLPSVRSRQEPLANLKTAQPIADLLKSRFQAETSSDTLKAESKIESDRKKAVQEKRFGYLTRTKYNWHPSKLLCKYFNVEDPYPGSQMVGTIELQKRVPQPQISAKLDSLGNLGLPNTQRDVIDRLGREAQDRRLRQNDDGSRSERKSRFDEDYSGKEQRKFNVVEKPVFLPPVELLQSVFELPDKAVESSSDSEPEDKRSNYVTSLMNKLKEKPVEKPKERFITILDVVPDQNEYGPRIPESMPSVIPLDEKIKFVPTAPQQEVIQLDSDSSDSADNYRPAKKHKRRSKDSSEKKERKRSKDRSEKHKKEKKHKSKKSKKGKKRHHDSSSD